MLLLIFFVSHLATFRGAANAQTNDLLSVGALVKFVSCYSDYSGVDGPMDPAGIVHTTSSALDCLIDCASYVYAGWNGVAGCYCGNSYHIELLVEENLNVCRVSVTKRGRNRRSYSHIAIFKMAAADGNFTTSSRSYAHLMTRSSAASTLPSEIAWAAVSETSLALEATDVTTFTDVSSTYLPPSIAPTGINARSSQEAAVAISSAEPSSTAEYLSSSPTLDIAALSQSTSDPPGGASASTSIHYPDLSPISASPPSSETAIFTDSTVGAWETPSRRSMQAAMSLIPSASEQESSISTTTLTPTISTIQVLPTTTTTTPQPSHQSLTATFPSQIQPLSSIPPSASSPSTISLPTLDPTPNPPPSYIASPLGCYANPNHDGGPLAVNATLYAPPSSYTLSAATCLDRCFALGDAYAGLGVDTCVCSMSFDAGSGGGEMDWGVCEGIGAVGAGVVVVGREVVRREVVGRQVGGVRGVLVHRVVARSVREIGARERGLGLRVGVDVGV